MTWAMSEPEHYVTLPLEEFEARKHESDTLAGALSKVLEIASDEIRRADRLAREGDVLRAKLSQHHAIHNLPEGHLVGDQCPICKEVEDRASRPGR